MLTYRRIETDKRFARRIWLAEQSAPRWWVEASAVWTPDYKSFLKFWRNCEQIFGLFDDENLVAAVYFDFLSGKAVNLHVSVVGKVKPDALVRFFKSLKVLQESNGVRSFEGWILDKNKGLIKLGREAGFFETGLRMSYGANREKTKVFRWIQVRG